MKIPSVTKLYGEARETFQRFPFVILSSIIGAFIMIYIIQVDATGSDYYYLQNAVVCCGLGISFLLSLTLRNEVFKLPRTQNTIIQGVGVASLVLYYFWLPKELGEIEITRSLLFALGLHLLVSFASFMNNEGDRQESINAFWRFNKLFFIRILTSVLFSGVLYIGLCIAIVSFDKLFDVSIEGKIYPQLFYFILGVFNTWFFLAGIPQSVQDFYLEDVYPKGLKIFTQFVLLPLVTVYLVILYLYMGKIIIQWNLPEGWVSYLILCFSITGIFSLLLIYPIRDYAENRWIKIFSKSFYIALLPLIVLLFTAILTRLFEYGITEKRYFVFVLACWLTFISLYFLISKTKNIKIIPITLFILAFGVSFGPWGAFSVSERSQMGRLEKLLINNKILVDGKIVPAKEKINPKDEGNISSIVYYLSQRNSIGELKKWLGTGLDTILTKEKYSQSLNVMKLMGLEYQSSYREFSNSEKKEYFSYTFDKTSVTKVSDYDFYSSFHNYRRDDDKNQFADTTYIINIDSTNKLGLTLMKDPCMMKITYNGEEVTQYNFYPMIDSMKSSGLYKSFPAEKGRFTIEGSKIKLGFNLESIGGYFQFRNPTVRTVVGGVLIKLKDK
ncbi:MAG: DUF4153 domain-containing protein [Ignavibacteria bacterium]|nr:DUF4153 domain-containing protein [Ignavibacteria bacterium]